MIPFLFTAIFGYVYWNQQSSVVVKFVNMRQCKTLMQDQTVQDQDQDQERALVRTIKTQDPKSTGSYVVISTDAN